MTENIYNDKVQPLLIQADDHLTAAEQSLSKEERLKVVKSCRSAVSAMLKAFLYYHGQEPPAEPEEIGKLFTACEEIEEEFRGLEPVFLLLKNSEPPADPEELADIVDGANEVWDFVLSFLPEKYNL